MARGFLQGVVLGGVVSVGVASIASVFMPPPLPPQVSDVAPDGGQTPAQDTGSGSDASMQQAAPLVGQVAPQTPAPAPDTLAALDGGTTTPAALPETGEAEALSAPGTLPETGGVALQADDPVLPNPQALAPMAPQEADALSISTEPAQPPAPQAEESAFSDAAVDPVADTPAAPQNTDEAPAPAVITQAPQAPEAPTPATETAQSQADQAPQVAMAEPEPQDAPQVAMAEPEAEETPHVRAPVPAPVSPPVLNDPAPADPVQTEESTAEDSQTASARPRIGTPAISLTNRQSNVTVNRPGSAAQDSQVVPVQTEPEQEQVTLEGMLPPLQAFAQPFDRTGNKPLMGIVLIDDGTQLTSGAQGIAALRSFPYPLSFAVDASKPDAAERMALFRDAGFEVLAMIDLPEGAQPSDAETTFNVLLPRLNQVVAVLEGPTAGFQSGRDLSDQVTAILADSGLGLVTQDKGLNTMPKLARKGGVPAAPVFRDFDNKGQSAAVIRRFLDQAAFKAGQEGAVIMLGRLRPDTISALLLWGLQDRASSVALAPISAVLTRE